MNHADKNGKLLKIGHRVLVPGKIVGLRDAAGRFTTTIQLTHRYDNTPEEIILNHGQVELHPDEAPVDAPAEAPKPTGVQDSNVGTVTAQPPAPETKPEEPKQPEGEEPIEEAKA